MRTAIVTTLRNAEATLSYFVAYHLAIGFDHLFLFFDDPNDSLFEQFNHWPDVTAIRNDSLLKKLWLRTKSATSNYAFAQREVMARQIMNAEVAAMLAFDMDIDWLLHIDADELFYPSGSSVKDHFNALSDQNINVVRYLNHEAIPETPQISNFFTEVSLFKRNRGVFDAHQNDVFRNQIKLPMPYFHFYDNGKSAALVTRQTRPMGVHEFEPGGSVIHSINAPCILHFPCCGYTHFLAKYKTLGQFTNKWFDRGDDIIDIAPVHVLSRDTVRTDNDSAIRQFYDEVYIQRYAEYTAACLAEGIFFRLHLPQPANLRDLLLAESHSRTGSLTN